MISLLKNGLFGLFLASGAAIAAPETATTAPVEATGLAKYFVGVTLVDQNGREVDMYRDVIADHTVVMHSFFAGCSASCPVMMSTLQSVQGRLGERMEREVRLISITVDPERDTPAALKEYAQRVHAKPGWLFLTGSPDQVALALKRIGQYAAEPADHMDLMIAGNTHTGLWKKIHGMGESRVVADLIVGVADDKGAAAP